MASRGVKDGTWPWEASVARESTSSFQGWPLWALSWCTEMRFVLAVADARALASPWRGVSTTGSAWAVQMPSA
eukprot:461963-Alexandrium_andersonii.AAC.1